ncbi:hypothetical protein LTR84_001334 [Exophiala bonariae]|uniref:ABM domain-containing protein n=1 Tax=Exophiala bonariae TaxID=1690606 RepID=A0AAV9NCH4_9EURO|nr:hypothetical protein LTR84_001334 [Exophiala bonariae]
MASAFVEEHRQAVPISQFITSNSPNGILMSMDVYIDSSKLDEYVKIVTPVVHKMREYPECSFCEISKNPNDTGHIRILHGWTTTSDWIRDNIETQSWFGDYIKSLAPMRDTTKPQGEWRCRIL